MTKLEIRICNILDNIVNVIAIHSFEFLCRKAHGNDVWSYILQRVKDRNVLKLVIHSFSHFYSAPSSPLLLRGTPEYSTDTVSESHAEAHRQL